MNDEFKNGFEKTAKSLLELGVGAGILGAGAYNIHNEVKKYKKNKQNKVKAQKYDNLMNKKASKGKLLAAGLGLTAAGGAVGGAVGHSTGKKKGFKKGIVTGIQAGFHGGAKHRSAHKHLTDEQYNAKVQADYARHARKNRQK